MDEQFFNKLKMGADKVFSEAEKFAGNAVNKTSNLINKTKINYAVNANEEKIKDILAEVGKIVYNEFKSGSEFPEDISQKLSAVEELYDEVAELKAKIAENDNSILCPQCGEYCSKESEYCSKCGSKINREEE